MERMTHVCYRAGGPPFGVCNPSGPKMLHDYDTNVVFRIGGLSHQAA